MTPLGKVVAILVQFGRRLRLRFLFGVKVPRDCWVGRHVTISGRVRVSRQVTIRDEVTLTGAISIGSNCVIDRHVEMHGNIEIGEKSVIGSFAILSTAPHAKMRIGIDTYINSFNVLGASSTVNIGNHCIFAAFVCITDATHGIDDLSVATKHSDTAASPVEIGDNVWLGSGVMVTMGSSIGDDAVVGAKSLVRGHVAERSVSFGIPAKIHRIRE
jgi:acetyltransferase-like isoleucine patch superfamily enzyme